MRWPTMKQSSPTRQQFIYLPSSDGKFDLMSFFLKEGQSEHQPGDHILVNGHDCIIKDIGLRDALWADPENTTLQTEVTELRDMVERMQAIPYLAENGFEEGVDEIIVASRDLLSPDTKDKG